MASQTTSRVSRRKIQQYLHDFAFKDLFLEELGWNRLQETPFKVSVEDTLYVLRPLVEKCGVRVFVCDPDKQGKIPSDRLLRKIEHKLAYRGAYEQFIIYVDALREHQVWQWVKRDQGKAATSRINRYHKGQSGELLAQKLEMLAVRLEEEEHMHMLEILRRVTKAFDTERVTKKFYDRFQLEHTAFLELIQGIEEQTDRAWYASLMLNRLMFIYFIQRQGFLDTKEAGKLDGDPRYLANRFQLVQQQRGKNQFHTFYRYFLLKLFHKGLNQRDHAPELEKLLGKVPYLNGGLFDIHVLERLHPEIYIPDEAFLRLFAFLDEFDWHLDNRPLHNDREINPDVLGYIFEKYINQKQMGAYYTKEDITDYISKYSLLPFILDETRRHCQVAFSAGGPIWMLLRENPDVYIYDTLKKGCELELPSEIAAGTSDAMQRVEWDRPALEAYALPMESWREVVARRTRYQEVRSALIAEQITSVNDLITYNLDIRYFAEDVITYCTSTDLLRALYESIAHVTVLDPTCGSGAFLFAALNILEGLYRACLERMQDLLEEREVLDAALPAEKLREQADLLYFRTILEQVGQHANRTYFIYKSIIVHNLYGVDIMEEAAEICKLRLFLKLVSQVETFADIEPLPDIDFNIRVGNTLVGFVSYEETRRVIEGRIIGKGSAKGEIAIQNRMLFDDRLERIEQKAQEVEQEFAAFRSYQTTLPQNAHEKTVHKQRLQQMLETLRTELDGYQAAAYGIDRSTQQATFAQWQQNHRPFHWWVEFYGIMQRGWFDVIIGNPPYVEYSKIKERYQVQFYQTFACRNIYAYTMERSLGLMRQQARFGMIVPVSSVSAESYQALNALFLPYLRWISTYSNRPAKLFAGVEQRLTILLAQTDLQASVLTSPYQHWYEAEREHLFHMLTYCPASSWQYTGMPIKSGHAVAEQIFARLSRQKALQHMLAPNSAASGVWVHDGPTYWVRALSFEPNPGLKSQRSDHYHRIPARTQAEASMLSALLSSSTFYLFYKLVSNCRDLGHKEWLQFPFERPETAKELRLVQLGKGLAERLQITAAKRTRHYASGAIVYEEYYPARAKDILDEIDRVLASHYGFTAEELDFIIQHDLKYRMGRHPESEESEVSQ
jgi:hypothetical protein